jgi:phenylalanyl-tRNA synthetase beta chain
MNILIPYSWLKEHVQTNANAKQFANSLSLCGPTVNRLIKNDDDYIFDIEVTTNRVDAMSVRGIAREAAAILPQFGYRAKLKPLVFPDIKSDKPLGIKIVDKENLSKRTLAIKLTNITLAPSPKWLADRLISVGQRPLANAIDITNYVMWEIGHPIHAFDYDKISEKKIVIRKASEGEKLITLDNKIRILKGGEIVFDDSKGEIIDLPGIMGTKNTVVDKDSKNILLWIESLDPASIRRVSMSLSLRSQAAVLNEKGIDPQLALDAILRAIDLYQVICSAKISSRLIDTNPKKYTKKSITIGNDFINQRLGINISPDRCKNILEKLGFEVKAKTNNLKVFIPSWRALDILIPEDIIEEIARIYGYFHLPSKLPEGKLPSRPTDNPFDFEKHLKRIMADMKAIEIYTLSLVAKKYVSQNALKLKNPLGNEMEYLRTSLMPSLEEAVKLNSNQKDPYLIFEVANTYHAVKDNLPEEKMTLAGVFANTGYRKAKGVVESLLEKLNINYNFVQEEADGFLASKRLAVYCNNKLLGEFGINLNSFLYFEFYTESLRSAFRPIAGYRHIPKYPPQIEDLTLIFPEKTLIGKALDIIKKQKHISNATLVDTYKDSYTFRVWYQNPKKTLTDSEVEEIRKKLLSDLKKKCAGKYKDW